MLNVVICGGFSPGARVLRAAMHSITTRGEVNVITLGPSLAGLEKPAEDIKSLDPLTTVVVDACEGGCGNQGLVKLGVMPKSVLVLPKYPIVSEKNVKDAEARVMKFIEGARQ